MAHGSSRRPKGTPHEVQALGQSTASGAMGCCAHGYDGSQAIVVPTKTSGFHEKIYTYAFCSVWYSKPTDIRGAALFLKRYIVTTLIFQL